jgi:hypothetical protein
MSQEYYLVCHQCKKKVHIGCEGLGGFQFWSGEPKAMQAARSLLSNCVRHIDKLGFVWEDSQADEEFEELE